MGATATFFAAGLDRWLAVAIAFVVLHFFLFCNVLRMRRVYELVWAGSFLALSGLGVRGNIPLDTVFPASCLMTIVLAAFEMRAPGYHGVGWRRLNPGLPEFWQARHGPAASGESSGV